MTNCHIISLNVRGLRNKEKRNQIFRWCRQQRSDIIFFQETYWTNDFEMLVRNEWPGPCFFAHGSNHSRGVSIMFNEKFEVQNITVRRIFNGQLLILTVEIQESILMLINVYAPTQRQHRELFYARLSCELQKHYTNDCELILGGDWNSVQSVTKDVQGLKSSHYKRPTTLKKIIKKYELSDVWRCFHPDVRQFTWRNLSLKRASRLDYWLVSKDVRKRTIHTDIRPNFRTDHNAISIKLCFKQSTKGPGYWKINTNTLKDELYQNGICNLIDSVSSSDLPVKLRWEMFKIKVREFSQKYCRKKALEKKDSKCLLELKLSEIEKRIDANNFNDKDMKDYSDVKEKLDKI